MIRKSIAFVFSLLALALFALILFSTAKRLSWPTPASVGQGQIALSRGKIFVQASVWETRPIHTGPKSTFQYIPNPLRPFPIPDNHLKRWLCDAQRLIRLPGFQLATIRENFGVVVTTHVTFSLWVPFLILAVFPFTLFAAVPFRNRRRMRQGLCYKCAYNLTGNTSGICPECGTPTTIPKWWRWAWFPLVVLRLLPLFIIAGTSFLVWRTIRQGSEYPTPQRIPQTQSPGDWGAFDGVQWEQRQQFLPERIERSDEPSPGNS